MESEYEDIATYVLPRPRSLASTWLRLYPSSETYYMEFINALKEGLKAIQSFERWSKHPDMKLYIDVLE